MPRTRWTTFVVAFSAVVAIAALAGALAAGGEREGLGGDPDLDADRAGEGHVGSPAGYQLRNRVKAPTATAAAVGWAGEVQVANEDTWEPEIAADPSSPYVYAFYTRYSPSCGKTCPSPAVMLRISADGGVTWGAEKLMPSPRVQGQYDPVITTTATGVVYATWMNYNTIVFSKSSDRGATWSAPVTVSGHSWADKPWLGTSNNGTDVYVGYASRSQLYLTASHNAGATWSAPVAVNSDTSVYRYPNGFAVLPSGVALLSVSKYPGSSKQATGDVDIEVWRTTNGGTSWSKVLVDDTLFTGLDFNTSSTTTLVNAGSTLVLEYSGATTLGGNGHIYARRSTDGGLTWSARTELGDPTANASFPAIASRGTSDVRLTWMDDRGGAWNVWTRGSVDGGQTWSAAVDISDATGGAPYKTAAGFTSPYGDYDGLAITNGGKSVSVAGEGASFGAGPGSIWFNRQT